MLTLVIIQLGTAIETCQVDDLDQAVDVRRHYYGRGKLPGMQFLVVDADLFIVGEC